MLLDIVMLLGGGTLLYFGAEWLVAGAAGLARSFGVPSLLVGLTVVAYGTSMPEVIVGVQAAAGGYGALALGNVLGSNVANLGLILGLAALVSPAKIDGALPKREVPVLVVSALLTPLLLLDGRVQVWEGVVLVALAIGYTAWMVRTARSAAVAEASEAAEVTAEAADVAGAPEPRGGRLRLAGLAVVGLVVLSLGGHLLVEGAVGIATAVGMSERLVGLTIVAVGTSLPELATSLIAARRGHSDIAVGNVIGSNIFNVLLCLGGASIVGGIDAPIRSVAVDLGAMLAFTLVGAVMMRSARTVTRVEGGILAAGYVAFLTSLVLLG
jgi:cation:H+ antiporter